MAVLQPFCPSALFSNFSSYCPELLPLTPHSFFFLEIPISPAGRPCDYRIYSDYRLDEDRLSKLRQVAEFSLQRVSLTPSSLYQIQVSSTAAYLAVISEAELYGVVVQYSGTCVRVRVVDDRVVSAWVVRQQMIAGNEWVKLVRRQFLEVEDVYPNTNAGNENEGNRDCTPGLHPPPAPSALPSQYAAASEWASHYPPTPPEPPKCPDFPLSPPPPPLISVTPPTAITEDLYEYTVNVLNIDIEERSVSCGHRRLPIRSLANCSRWSPGQAASSLSLSTRYTHWRKTRSDGNCYYRCIAVSYLEYLCRDLTPVKQFVDFYEGLLWQQTVLIPGRLAPGVKYFLGRLRELFRWKKDGKGMQSLHGMLKDTRFDIAAVVTLRCVALKMFERVKNDSDFAAFLIDPSSDQVAKSIATLGIDAEGCIFQILAEALDVKIVHILLSPTYCREESFMPRSPGQKPILHLLLKPGHYDVLYPLSIQLVDQYHYATDTFHQPKVPVSLCTVDMYTSP